MVRIGSPHSGVVTVHLVAKRSNGKATIDGHTLKLLRSKKSLIESVLGVSTQGALEFEATSKSGIVSDTKELIRGLSNDDL